MGRVLSSAFCVALLAAAAAAFALTEGAKTELSPIFGTKIDKIFSPTCDPRICGSRVAHIRFDLRRRQRLDVWIDDAAGKRVRTIVGARAYSKGRVQLVFDGRASDGALLPDGPYVPVVRLIGGLTITLPNQIVLDTKPPQVLRHPHDLRTMIAPGAVGRPQFVSIPYTLGEHAHGVLFANGRRVVFTFREAVRGVLRWSGTIDRAPVAPGRYTLELAAQDEAGNRSKPVVVAQVNVRYLELAKTRIEVRPHERFSVAVPIGPARLRWLFAGRHGVARTHLLHLRAPKRRGHYRLYVTGSGHDASAVVVVG